jgi:ubiquitin carboxyl-terminal hydrolase 47
MAFTNFLKIEKLEKDNQYFCSKCDKKVDAHKYLKFTKMPQILFLQMNRFEYDYMAESRRKICDRVSFPIYLDMNPFLKYYLKFKLVTLKK